MAIQRGSTYYAYSSSTASTSYECDFSEPVYEYPKDTNIKMTWEPKKSKKKTPARKYPTAAIQSALKSELMIWFHKKFGISPYEYYLLLHSPLYTSRSSKLLKDFITMKKHGYRQRGLSTTDPKINVFDYIHASVSSINVI